MKATLIFDTVNDLVYSKWDDTFLQRMMSFGNMDNKDLSDIHEVSQLLSPIVTSQRVMAVQFGNTYSSIVCKDKTAMVFDEWLDHLFMNVGEERTEDVHRELLDCKTFVQHICGQNIRLLHSPIYQEWLSVLLESRQKGDSVPGASGVIGETRATAAALNALKASAKEIKCSSYSHYHFMLFVGDKLLALYSSRGSEDLMPPDRILMSIQCIAAQEYWKDVKQSDANRNTGQRLPWLSEENSAVVYLCSGQSASPCVPHSMHLAEVVPRITFVVLVDMELREAGAAVQMTNQVLANLRRLLLQRNLEMLPSTLDSLEASLKKTTDALRKNKANANLNTKLTNRMQELRKSCTTTTPLTPETAASALHTALESAIDILKPDIPSLKMENPVKELRTILAPFVDFLRVKAQRYFSMGSAETDSDSLSMHSYVGEYPGLIHFVFVDRTSGRFQAPDMADCAGMLTPKTIRRVISRWLALSLAGYSAATWRSGPLRVSALRWWERTAVPTQPAKPPHVAAVRALPPPGDITGAFYRQLVELAFPKDSAGVSIKELICIHLGLLPAPTAVQQARRLAHAAHDFGGDHPAASRAADLL